MMRTSVRIVICLMTAFLMAAMGASAATMEPVFDRTAEATFSVGPVELHNSDSDNDGNHSGQPTAISAEFVVTGYGDHGLTVMAVNDSDPNGGGNDGADDADDPSNDDNNNGTDPDPVDPTFDPVADLVHIRDSGDYQQSWQMYVNDSDDGGGNNNGSDDADDPGNDDGNVTDPVDPTHDPVADLVHIRDSGDSQQSWHMFVNDSDDDGSNENDTQKREPQAIWDIGPDHGVRYDFRAEQY